MEIKGKAALITGAGSGIGRATALALAARGAARVHILDRNDRGANETAEAVRAAGAEAVVHVADVADALQLRAVFDAAETAGGLDIVHNNAGMVVGRQLYPDTSLQKVQEIVAVNLTAVLLGTQWGAQQMRARGGGVVINTASMAALHSRFRDWLYSATKAAVASFTSACAPLAEAWGVRVNAVLPGLVNTPILLTTGDGELAEYMTPVLANNVPMEPEDIAAAVIGLIEDDARVGELACVTNADPQTAQFDNSFILLWS